ncbi:enoyl-CoA hydratase/isomerase family protein [Hymenobacter sp. NST-14]|uniref:enoyl-CoA hydratase/isomerase family protein n=1 Tax=Hymenobacter piscis TaxID=2839984 RepID=UPI001C03309B|nr:enoyl-CoA hydratase-related protein [Hymenobacter piscis]MBT9393306.1 enoyl-CoA hydratase/isomerase family protein [Hymenobacter piscis]
MPTFENLLYELEAETGILTLTINRPDKLNALNAATIEEIRTAIQRVLDDPQVRGVILTGSGHKAFVAGADIAELTRLDEISARRASERGQEAFCSIEESTKPVIAAVNGFALGGGCELAMACHLRVAAENARFGQPEVNLGLIPGYGGTQRLAQLVGKGRAIELLLTADMVKADEALRLGLVNHVVPQAELLSFTRDLLLRILTKAPLALGLCLDSVNAYYDQQRHGYQTEANAFARCFGSEDFREGTTAFLEKRPAVFTGN